MENSLSRGQKFTLWILGFVLLMTATIGGYAYGSWKSFITTTPGTNEISMSGEMSIPVEGGQLILERIEAKVDSRLVDAITTLLALND